MYACVSLCVIVCVYIGFVPAAATTAAYLPCNVSREVDIHFMLDKVEKKFGTCDVFVGNAGVMGAIGGVEAMTDKDFKFATEINVLQHIWAARKLIPRWKARPEGGAFVVVASAAGLLTQIGSLAYAITKRSAGEYCSISFLDHRVTILYIIMAQIKCPCSWCCIKPCCHSLRG